MPGLRVALLLAAPFPAPQGSQRFVATQALALREAGADPSLFVYGHGDGRVFDALPLCRAPRWLTPKSLRSGLGPRRPLADLGLGWALLRAHRARRFDAIVAHNAEAALLALTLRPALQCPVLYVAHTLWEEELASYLPGGAAGWARQTGCALDRHLARSADASIALSSFALRRLRDHGARRVERIPPPHRIEAPCSDEVARQVCARHGLSPGDFALYAGNLDRYQNLDLLDAAAERLSDLPVVVATHDAAGADLPHLRVVEIASPETARALIATAALVVVPRCAPGGFPIKLLEAMEASRALVARAELADTLCHGASGWLLPASVDGRALAEVLRGLARDPALRHRLGRGARRSLETHHDPATVASATCALLAELAATRR